MLHRQLKGQQVAPPPIFISGAKSPFSKAFVLLAPFLDQTNTILWLFLVFWFPSYSIIWSFFQSSGLLFIRSSRLGLMDQLDPTGPSKFFSPGSDNTEPAAITNGFIFPTSVVRFDNIKQIWLLFSRNEVENFKQKQPIVLTSYGF